MLALVALAVWLIIAWALPRLGQLMRLVLLFCLGLTTYLVFDPRLRRAIWQSWVRWWDRILTRLGITPPEGRVRAYLSGLEADLADMERHLRILRKHRVRLSALMETNRQKMQGHLDRAAQLTHAARRQLELRKAARLRQTTEKYRMLDRRLETVTRVLERLSMHTRILLEDMREEIALRQREAEAFSSAAAAMNEARNVLDKRALFEEIERSLEGKAAEVHTLMERLRSWLEHMEPEAGAFAEEGLEMLEEWERKHLKYQNPARTPRLPERSSLDSPFDRLFDETSD